MKTAMVVLASEQLWPNLSGLVHWQKTQGGLNRLYIYTTDSLQFSGGPANRLEALCRSLWPDVHVVRLAQPGGVTPQDVHQTITHWMQSCDAGWHWVINGTGGLKLMTTGLSPFLSRPNCEVIYREVTSGQWYRIAGNPTCAPTATEFTIAPEETDDLPVHTLVELQFEAVAGASWSWEHAAPLPLLDITTAGLASHWNWRTAFEAAGLPADVKGSFLFERYIAAVLVAYGCRNTITNLCLTDAGGVALEEIDVIANTKGRLVIIDCKLSAAGQDAVPLIAQINRGDAIRKQLGGLNAIQVLLRPNLLLTDSHRRLAEASRLITMDMSDMPHFFEQLGKMLRLPLSDSLRQCQEVLTTAAADKKRIFTQTPATLQQMLELADEASLLNFDRLLEQWQTEQQRTWCAWLHRNMIHIKGQIVDEAGFTDRDQVQRAFAKLVAGFAEVAQWSIPPSRRSFYAMLRLHQDQRGMLQRCRTFLQQRVPTNFFASANDDRPLER